MNHEETNTSVVTATKVVCLSVRRPAAVAEARRRACAFLQRLEPAVEPDVGDTVVLVVSELVTNALRHAGGMCFLELAAAEHHIDVFVRDASPLFPLMRTPDLNGGAGGFGWPMVRRLASHVTVTHEEHGGKTIRARLHRHGDPQA
ncbi:ATP-binding protein [Streptomyces sp. NPDC088762]|uniref:ATP-binding protein n=1 Tax=Streptomyces sp. NPDC088762 TaxID=3365891 RepID=UPI0037FB8170